MNKQTRRFTKRGLATLYGLFLLLLIVSAYVITFAKAPAPPDSPAAGFNMTILSEMHDIIRHAVIVEVQNFDNSSAQPFNLKFFIQNTTFPLSNVSNIEIYEYKPIPVTYAVYDSRTIQVNHEAPTIRNNVTNVTSVDPSFDLPVTCAWLLGFTYACPYNETYVNGSVIKNTLTWKPTKMAAITQPDKVSATYGNITIPKYNAKTSTDDFGTEYNINGKKLFKITWQTPLAYKTAGQGYWGVADANTNVSYDPWWNSNWDKKALISVTETANLARVNETITLAMSDISGFSRSDVQDDCDDIRILNPAETSEIAFTNITCNSTAVVLEFPCQASASASDSTCAYVYWDNGAAESPTTGNSLATSVVGGALGTAGWFVTYGPAESRVAYEVGRTPANPIFGNRTGMSTWGRGDQPGLWWYDSENGAVVALKPNKTVQGLHSVTFSMGAATTTHSRNMTYYDTGKAKINNTFIGTTAATDYYMDLVLYETGFNAAFTHVFFSSAGTYSIVAKNTAVADKTSIDYFGLYNSTTNEYLAFVLYLNNTPACARYRAGVYIETCPGGSARTNPSWNWLVLLGVNTGDLESTLDNEYTKARYPLTVSAGAVNLNVYAPSIDNVALVPSPTYYMNVTTCRANVTNGGENVVSVLFNVTLTTNSSALVEGNGTTPYSGGEIGVNWTTGNFQPSVIGTNAINCTVIAQGATKESAKTQLFSINEAAPALIGSVSPASPFYTTQANFVCNYTTGSGGSPASTKISGATVLVNLDGYNRTATEETNGYTYTNSTASVGNHNWYCIGYKTNYNALITSTSSVTIQNNPPTINSFVTNPSVPIFGYSNIQAIVNATDDVGVTSLALNWTWPNSTKSNIDNLTQNGDIWTSSNFSIEQFGVYNLNVTACDDSNACISTQSTFAVLMNASTNIQNSTGGINLPTEIGDAVTIRFNYTRDYNFTAISTANTNVTIFNASSNRPILSTNNPMTYLSSIGLWQFNYTIPTGINGTYKYNIRANVTSTTFGSYVDLNGTFDTRDTTSPAINTATLDTSCSEGNFKRTAEPVQFDFNVTDSGGISLPSSLCNYTDSSGTNSLATPTLMSANMYRCTFATAGNSIGTLQATIQFNDTANNSATTALSAHVVTACNQPSSGGGIAYSPYQDITAPKSCLTDLDCNLKGYICDVTKYQCSQKTSFNFDFSPPYISIDPRLTPLYAGGDSYVDVVKITNRELRYKMTPAYLGWECNSTAFCPQGYCKFNPVVQANTTLIYGQSVSYNIVCNFPSNAAVGLYRGDILVAPLEFESAIKRLTVEATIGQDGTLPDLKKVQVIDRMASLSKWAVQDVAMTNPINQNQKIMVKPIQVGIGGLIIAIVMVALLL